MNEIKKIKSTNNQSDKPPIFSSWKNMYVFVFAQLLFLIALLYLFTRYFS
jgi:hypothetical protein